MATKVLTDMRARSRLTPGRHSDGKIKGLALDVKDTGTKSWVLRYTPPLPEFRKDGRTAGRKKVRNMGLGSYPEVSIPSARELAANARELLAQGLDPIEVRKQQRVKAAAEASQKVTTFDEVVSAYLAAKVNLEEGGFKNPKHRQQWHNTLKTYASPLIGQVNIADVDTECVLRVLRQDTGKGNERGQLWYVKTETASRIRGRIEAVLSWATFREWRPKGNNPALWKGHLDQELAAPGKLKKVRHHPALPYPELPTFMRHLRARKGVASRALEFAILTASHSSEVREALWSEIDMKKLVWAIPEERMKAGRAHEVPLTRRMLEILKALPRQEGNPHVFVGDSWTCPAFVPPQVLV